MSEMKYLFYVLLIAGLISVMNNAAFAQCSDFIEYELVEFVDYESALAEEALIAITAELDESVAIYQVAAVAYLVEAVAYQYYAYQYAYQYLESATISRPCTYGDLIDTLSPILREFEKAYVKIDTPSATTSLITLQAFIDLARDSKQAEVQIDTGHSKIVVKDDGLKFSAVHIHGHGDPDTEPARGDTLFLNAEENEAFSLLKAAVESF